MPTYYRFQNEQPKRGDSAHCFKTKADLKNFALFMQSQDPDFKRMKFWEVEGALINEDDGDVNVRVISAKEITL